MPCLRTESNPRCVTRLPSHHRQLRFILQRPLCFFHSDGDTSSKGHPLREPKVRETRLLKPEVSTRHAKPLLNSSQGRAAALRASGLSRKHQGSKIPGITRSQHQQRKHNQKAKQNERRHPPASHGAVGVSERHRKHPAIASRSSCPNAGQKKGQGRGNQLRQEVPAG